MACQAHGPVWCVRACVCVRARARVYVCVCMCVCVCVWCVQERQVRSKPRRAGRGRVLSCFEPSLRSHADGATRGRLGPICRGVRCCQALDSDTTFRYLPDQAQAPVGHGSPRHQAKKVVPRSGKMHGRRRRSRGLRAARRFRAAWHRNIADGAGALG